MITINEDKKEKLQESSRIRKLSPCFSGKEIIPLKSTPRAKKVYV